MLYSWNFFFGSPKAIYYRIAVLTSTHLQKKKIASKSLGLSKSSSSCNHRQCVMSKPCCCLWASISTEQLHLNQDACRSSGRKVDDVDQKMPTAVMCVENRHPGEENTQKSLQVLQRPQMSTGCIRINPRSKLSGSRKIRRRHTSTRPPLTLSTLPK